VVGSGHVGRAWNALRTRATASMTRWVCGQFRSSRRRRLLLTDDAPCDRARDEPVRAALAAPRRVCRTDRTAARRGRGRAGAVYPGAEIGRVDSSWVGLQVELGERFRRELVHIFTRSPHPVGRTAAVVSEDANATTRMPIANDGLHVPHAQRPGRLRSRRHRQVEQPQHGSAVARRSA
jgi:hypothetical protein